MSDYPVDTGWWVASDGKWYPPELHPGASAPTEQAEPDVDQSTRSVDPRHWHALRMAAESAGLAAPPHHNVSDTWDWRQNLGVRALKGIRSEVNGSTYFLWSLLVVALGAGYLAAVVHDNQNTSFMLLTPLAVTVLYPWYLVRVRQDRRSKASIGSLLPQHTRRQLAWLAAGTYLSVLGGGAAVVACAIYWGFQASRMLK